MTDLIKQLTGRARFCRDRGEEKTPGLLEEAAAQLAEAQAAQAGVVREACEAVSAGYAAWAAKPHNAKWVRRIDGTPIPNDLLVCIQTAIRALADPTGVKLLAELRAERDALAADGAGVFWAEKARAFAMQMASVDARAKDAESERDRLAAANAALEAKVAGLRDFVDDFAKAKIDALRYSPPCGSSPEDDPDPVVDAETVWAWQADAKAALADAEAAIARMEDVLEIVAAGPILGEPMARWINHMMAKARAAMSRPHATKGDEG